MDYVTLRAAMDVYFRKQLNAAKARRALVGPLTEQEPERIADNVKLLNSENREYWQLLVRENAGEELNRFFESTGLSRDKYWPHAFRIFG